MERKSDHATTNRIYDEFEPIFNWKSEKGFETLTVHLPGFKKEQLKVQVTSTRKLRVIGERPAGANKWIRFRKEFPIQSNVDVDSVVARFEGANLVVKLSRTDPQTSPIGTTTNPPLFPKENLGIPSPTAKETEKAQPLKQTREKESELEKQAAERARKEEEEALKAAEKANVCDGVKQDYRNKMNAYRENLGGYVELMKNNKTAITAGMVAPAAAVLLLSIGFYAGRMFTSH